MPSYLTRKSLCLVRQQYEAVCQKLAAQPAVVRQAIESGGGTHDNAMYDSALHDQEVLVDRAKSLAKYLTEPTIVDEMEMREDTVTLAKVVRVKKEPTGAIAEFIILGEADKEFLDDPRIVSLNSPLGRQLLGHRAGDCLTVVVPAGQVEMEIVSIERWRPEDVSE